MEYSKKDDWRINRSITERLVRAWIDTTKLRINTTKGNVDIKGELNFTGQAKASIDSPMVIINMLKKLDYALKAIPNVKVIQYNFAGWSKQGLRWEYNPSKEQDKKDKKEEEGNLS
ncbi:MAG: hypothetical protein ABII27_04170 [bacterium]